MKGQPDRMSYELWLRNCQAPEIQNTCEGLLAEIGKSGQMYLTPAREWLLLDRTGKAVVLERGRKLARQLEQTGFFRNMEHVLRNNYYVLDFVAAIGDHPNVSDYIPLVRSTVNAPALKLRWDAAANTGKLVLRPVGYDPIDRMLCTARGVNTDALEAPDPSYPHLKKLFSGFMFADPVYYANLMAVFLACLARTALQQFPLILIDSERKSAGKSTLANAITYILTGDVAKSIVYSGDEKEFEGRFQDIVNKPGPNPILIDNVRAKVGVGGQIRSQFLSSLTAGHSACARVLYKAPQPVFSPIVFLTMNGGRVERDLGDKTVRISLRLPEGVTHRRFDPEPVGYATAYRQAILAEALHLLQRLQLDRVPCHTRFYDFEMVGVAAARALGLDPSFDPSRIVTADSFITEVYHLMQDEFGGAAVTFTDLVDRARAVQNARELHEWLRATHRSVKGQAIELRQILETNYVGQNLRLAKSQGVFVVEKNAANQYTLEFKENGPADCSPAPTTSSIITSTSAVEAGTLPASVV